MVKRDGEWYALFVLKKTVELVDEPETFMAIDRGRKKLSCCSSHIEKPIQTSL